MYLCFIKIKSLIFIKRKYIKVFFYDRNINYFIYLIIYLFILYIMYKTFFFVIKYSLK